MKVTILDKLEIQSVRAHFISIMDNQEEMIKNHKEIVTDTDFLKKMSVTLPSTSKYYLVDDAKLKYNLLVKNNNKTCGGVICPRLIDDYELLHLYSSIIANILLVDKATATTMKSAMYILYYFWFFRGKNKDEISANICSDIEAIIKLLIDRQYRTYNNKDISTPVDLLAIRLRNEKLLISPNTKRSINLRR